LALDVGKALKNPGQVFPFKTSLELPEMEVLSDPIRFEGIEAEGEFFCTGDHRISLRADVSATADSRCSRCLQPVQVPVKAQVAALYAKELDPEDPDLYAFEGNSLELTDAVKDALLLELPLQFFCRPDCKGLCPVCGINLNKGTCTCQEGNVVTGPFSALKDYVLNNEEV
jgi:uncharacterized protein